MLKIILLLNSPILIDYIPNLKTLIIIYFNSNLRKKHGVKSPRGIIARVTSGAGVAASTASLKPLLHECGS